MLKIGKSLAINHILYYIFQLGDKREVNNHKWCQHINAESWNAVNITAYLNFDLPASVFSLLRLINLSENIRINLNHIFLLTQ